MERKEAESRKAIEHQNPGEEDDFGNRIGKPGLVLYLDTSAIVKKYVLEKGSDEVIRAIANAQAAGTARIAKVEVAAAFGKAVRMGLLTEDAAQSRLQAFQKDWPDYYIAEISESVFQRAENFAWAYRLRGYDAVHLAAAAAWQDDLGESVTVATFDLQLWDAAGIVGLAAYPANLHKLIEEWSRS
jgi:predicted nucleic acid-binding protein